MKRIILSALVFSVFAMGAYAQNTPKADVAVGYSFFHINGSPGANLNGVSGSAAFNVNSWFGVVADFGVYHGSPSGIGVTNVTYTFGPRISFRQSDRFVPFGQALFGGSHLSASAGGVSGSTNPFAFSFGGGADISISGSGKVALRPQVDYFGLRSNGSTANSVRVSVGIVYNIGEK